MVCYQEVGCFRRIPRHLAAVLLDMQLRQLWLESNPPSDPTGGVNSRKRHIPTNVGVQPAKLIFRLPPLLGPWPEECINTLAKQLPHSRRTVSGVV